MKKKLLLKLFITCTICILISECTVVPHNYTPDEFPYVVPRDLPNSTFYPTTLDELSELAKNPKHRFLLEIEEKSGADTRNAYVIVNGTEYQMTNYGHRLWYFDSPNECQANYTYYFRVTYNAGGNKEKLLGSPEEPFSVTTSEFGNIIWGVPGKGVSTDTDGEVHFGENFGFTQTMTVQNLRNDPISITYIEIDLNHVSAPNSDQFEVVEKPVLPVQLNCGESLEFRVRWNAPSPPHRVTGAVKFGTGSPQHWDRSILLKGYPPAP
ncbi:MAG: hypothetical protein ACFFFT_11195 [Candidatus Thorarchaeota archaeon]